MHEEAREGYVRPGECAFSFILVYVVAAVTYGHGNGRGCFWFFALLRKSVIRSCYRIVNFSIQHRSSYHEDSQPLRPHHCCLICLSNIIQCPFFQQDHQCPIYTLHPLFPTHVSQSSSRNNFPFNNPPICVLSTPAPFDLILTSLAINLTGLCCSADSPPLRP